MPKYIDLDKVKITGEMFLDDDDEALIPLSDVRRALLMAPVEDVAPRSELERWRDMYYRANAERMASKNDCEILMASIKAERRVAEMNILKAIQQEIIKARIVNQKALADRRNEPGVDPKRDAHCFYCNGRIDALSCLLAFVEDLEKICLEEEK